MNSTKSLSVRALSVALVTLTATACGGSGGTTSSDDDRSVTILGAYTDADGNFAAMLDEFGEENGITIDYESSAEFTTVAVSRVEGGNPPDILLFPQPGALAEFARRDQVRVLGDVVGSADLDRLFPGLADLATVDGDLYGVPININLKSLVWYPEPAFSDAGYEVPETWEDLLALTDQIRADGTAPWCIGFESGGSTGWVATDWIEDIMLRLHGPDVYDQWTSGELPFNSAEVSQAFQAFADLAFVDENVLGGKTSILTTSFRDAPAPMFEDPPACFLHRQASFAASLFPEDAEFGTDFDVFYLPPMSSEDSYDGRPLMGGGDIAALATDNPAAEEVLHHLMTPEAFLDSRALDGGTLSAFTDVAAQDYPNAVDQAQAGILGEAELFRFDGSDLMPAQVGAGAFWTETVAWVNDEKDLATTLDAIDAAWP